jgi:hypothetical protein
MRRVARKRAGIINITSAITTTTNNHHHNQHDQSRPTLYANDCHQALLRGTLGSSPSSLFSDNRALGLMASIDKQAIFARASSNNAAATNIFGVASPSESMGGVQKVVVLQGGEICSLSFVFALCKNVMQGRVVMGGRRPQLRLLRQSLQKHEARLPPTVATYKYFAAAPLSRLMFRFVEFPMTTFA